MKAIGKLTGRQEVDGSFNNECSKTATVEQSGKTMDGKTSCLLLRAVEQGQSRTPGDDVVGTDRFYVRKPIFNETQFIIGETFPCSFCDCKP